MSDGQWCELRRKNMTRGECHTCNKYYRELGVHPFLRCLQNHTFSSRDAVCCQGQVLCPICGRSVSPEPPTGGGFCCDQVQCSLNCDWFLNPNHCNLARDPVDARRLMPKQYDLVYPETGQIKTIELDGYRVAMHQIQNQEILRISDSDLKAIGKTLSEKWSALKVLHKGNADEICRDMEIAYNTALGAKYPPVKVQIRYVYDHIKPRIDITGANSITAWLLHEIVPYVEFF